MMCQMDVTKSAFEERLVVAQPPHELRVGQVPGVHARRPANRGYIVDAGAVQAEPPYYEAAKFRLLSPDMVKSTQI